MPDLKKYLMCLCVLLSVAFISDGQNGNMWVFGRDAGLDFNKQPPEPFSSAIRSTEAAASVCDDEGRLLFYTNGYSVWDRNHKLMPDGEDLPRAQRDIITSTTQGAIIVPVPGDTSKYYVFSVGSYENERHGLFGRLYCSIVDMRLNNNMGNVESKGVLIDTGLTEHMWAVPGAECDIWLLLINRITHKFHAYRINDAGITRVPVTSERVPPADGEKHNGTIGSLDCSPDFTRLAVSQGDLMVYDFDHSTGKVSNPVVLDPDISMEYYGVCFSPDGSKVYSGSKDSLYQFDLNRATPEDMVASKISLGSFTAVSALKRAPDGKIYCANSRGFSSLSVINKPNLRGTVCEYRYNAQELTPVTYSHLGLPNVIATVLNKKMYSSRRDTVVCEDDVTLSAQNNDARNYRWQNGSTDRTFRAEASGTYWVSYQTFCKDYVDTFHLVLYKNERLYNTTELTAMCLADTFLMSARHVGTTDYTWNDGSTGKDKIALTDGVYWVNYNVDSVCRIYSDTFVVRYVTRDYTLSFDADTLTCVGEAIKFENRSEPYYKDFGWSYGDGTGSTEFSPQHEYLLPGRYEVKLVGRIHDKCIDSMAQFITVDSVFPVRFIVDKDKVCQGEQVRFYPTTDSNVVQLSWYYEGSILAVYNKPVVEHAFDRSGIFPIQLTAKNRVCPDTYFSDTLVVYPVPHIDLGTDRTICFAGQPLMLENKFYSEEDEYHYKWSTGDTTTVLKVVHEGVYTLTVEDVEFQCSNSETVKISRDCYIDIPDVFTPNGDGINDYFFPRQLLARSVAAFRMQIFNRWGQLIFETTSAAGRGWDGRLDGKELPVGGYVYAIRTTFIDGHSEMYRGSVVLIR